MKINTALLFVIGSLLVSFIGGAFLFYGSVSDKFIAFIFIVVFCLIASTIFRPASLKPARHQRDIFYLTILIIIGPGILAICFLIFGAPVLSGKSEVARVTFASNISLYNRIYPAVFYLLTFYSVILYRVGILKISHFIILFLSMVSLLFLTAFRGKILDLSIIALLAMLVKHRHFKFQISFMKAFVYFGIFFLIAFSLAILISMSRYENVEDVLGFVLARIFLINYETNIPRVTTFISLFGIGLGESYIFDPLSFFGIHKSFADRIDTFLVGESVFKMTVTIFGESIYNFGEDFYLLALIPILTYKIFSMLLPRIGPRPLDGAILFYSLEIVGAFFLARNAITIGVASSFFMKFLPLLFVFYLCMFISLIFGGKITIGTSNR